jgi:amino acid adenylation domain-containing protein
MAIAQRPSPIEDIYELSPLQHGMLFHTLHTPESRLYFEQEVFTVQGGLTASAFAECWQQVMNRHEVLRTSFHWSGLEKPLQVVHRDISVPIQHADLRRLPRDEQERTLEAYLAADRQNGFDLRVAPAMRLQLFDVAPDLSQFVWSFHHILLDGWSGQIVVKEAAAIYEAISQGRSWRLPLTRRYRDYIAWLQRQDADKAATFWHGALQGAAVPTPLGISFRPSAEARVSGNGEHDFSMSGAATSALNDFARAHRLTLNTILQGTWALLLSRYGGQDDVVFGAVVSGRPAAMPDVERMVGMFINTIPVRVQIAPEMRVVDWLEVLQAAQSEAREYQYSSLVDVKRWSKLPAGADLFETVLVCENFPVTGASRSLGKPAHQSRYLGRTNYPVTVLVVPGAELRVKLEFAASRFDAASMARMAGHYRVLLEGIVVDGQMPVGRLPLLSVEERRQVLEEWNATAVADEEQGCLHGWFEAQVARTPQALACVCGEAQLTYAELNGRANQLARHLQGLGVGPEVLVGIALERSPALLVGLLGVLKAGGAYVPLDPAYPAERLAYMLSDAQARVLLTQQSLAGLLPAGAAQVVCVDTQWAAIAQHGAGNLDAPVRPNQLAYVIYTSGSTGLPKGVMVHHGGLANYLRWSTCEYVTAGGRGAPVHSPLAFDLTITSLFYPLLTGQPVVLLPETAGVEALAACLRTHADFSLVKITPSHLEALSHLLRIDEVGGKVRTLVIGGEPLSSRHVEFWRAHAPDTRLINEYGPTETVVGCCVYELGLQALTSDAVPIGRPIANARCYVLDPYLNPVPIGITGELYIGGHGVTRGYLNLPELTAQKFIPDFFGKDPHTRLYNTGDLARYLPGGNLEFLGRRDQQVKNRGFRIELGEIEAVLRLHPGIRDAVVLLHPARNADKRLVAYVVPRHANAAPAALDGELRGALRRKLPDYMIPAVFHTLPALPLTPRGKVDRAALPVPDAVCDDAREYVAPRTPVERIVTRMYEDVLGVSQVGVHSDFFAHLGGHSLLATVLASRIREVFKIQSPLQRIFEAPTVAALAATLLEDEATRRTIETTAEVWLELIQASDKGAKADDAGERSF